MPTTTGGIAVTGLGTVCSAGAGTAAFRAALREGRRALGPIPRLGAAGVPMTVGGAVSDEAIGAGLLPPGEDRVLAMCRLAAAEALDAAALPAGARGEVGICLGTALGAVEQLEALLRERLAGPAEPPRTAARLRAIPLEDLAGRLSAELGLGGPRSTFSVTCASGLCALEQARADLAAGRARAVLVGAADALSPFMQAGFCSLKALSPAGLLRPCDPARDGIVLGEGAAFIVVEDLREARRRGAPVRAVLAGHRLRSDGTHLTSPDASGAGMAAAIGAALDDSALGAAAIGAVTFTAAGSPIYDRMQSRAVRTALGPAADRVPATTWEGTTGHALAATAILGIVHAAATIGEGQVLPIAGLPPHPPMDPECTLRYLVDAPEPFRGRAVLALTVGFGGQNGAVVVASPGEDRR